MFEFLFVIFWFLWGIWKWVAALLSVPSLLLYCAITGAVSFLPPVDLKKKYEARWALVTGASSGIGKQIAVKCAKQGLNVCLAALDDDLLANTHKELAKRFKKIEFRKVGVNLGKEGYLPELIKATEDIPIQVVFSNAGYMLTGFFVDSPLESQMTNLTCNAVSAVQITHHFAKRMIDEDLKGCIVYTSSPAACMPSPFVSLYASTKSFLSSFAAGVAAEFKSKGIDVCCVHPSPVASRFYDKAHKIDMLDAFKRFSVEPEDLPDEIFRGIGRTVWHDIGPTCIALRVLSKVADYNFTATFLAFTAHLMPDYQRHDKKKAT